MLRSGENQSAFAASIGIDRSALSQLLSGASTRLPRAETLMTIAETQTVSLDWLLGLSQDEGVTGEMRESIEIEEGGESAYMVGEQVDALELEETNDRLEIAEGQFLMSRSHMGARRTFSRVGQR